jgi:hypothetical protein
MVQTTRWPWHVEAVPGLPHVLIDYRAIDSVEEFDRLAVGADVIMAVNCGRAASGSAVVVYGRETLVRLAAEIDPPRSMTILPVAVNFDTRDVERLCAAVKRTKGRFEWHIQAS